MYDKVTGITTVKQRGFFKVMSNTDCFRRIMCIYPLGLCFGKAHRIQRQEKLAGTLVKIFKADKII